MIAIIEYNAGNSRSVYNALNRLNCEAVITSDKEIISTADKVIFPGVGEASSAMKFLRETGLNQTILNLKQPVLGVCLGLQLMCSYSEENDTECLGIFENRVLAFPSDEPVPHMGWNNFTKADGALFEGIEISDDVYYVHSYYAELSKESNAITQYMVGYSAALQKDNFYATQFHPEKSGDVGSKILQNFIEL
ncbi:MAG: imidazole glycerol phosphate synthase subunit HisH [Fluviicola sp. XM-24bin1]|nr:MAG: imidazole glycerol phosphate synthase subunit HisH [Fluviicola sp. XM-24bin1]